MCNKGLLKRCGKNVNKRKEQRMTYKVILRDTGHKKKTVIHVYGQTSSNVCFLA